MKKISSLLVALFAIITVSAQVQVTVTSAGKVKIMYGASNNYTFYAPGVGTQTFYIHMWSVPADNGTGAQLDDSWNNSNVTMNWSAADNAYVGNVDFATKLWTGTNNVIPAGTTLTNFGMVFKDQQNGATHQSADVQANTVGFTPTTIPALAVSNVSAKAKSSVVAGKLYTSAKGNLTLSVYEMSGKLVRTFDVKADGNAIDLNVPSNGLYLVKITNGSENEVVKFAK